MVTTHRELDGRWAPCPEPTACELAFHFQDMTPAELAATPLELLLPLFAIMDPPGRITESGEQLWYESGGRTGRHRDYDLPAAIDTVDGTMGWWQHGQVHRVGAPAVVGVDGYREWREQGKLHRIGGPAYVDPSMGVCEWWLRGIEISSPV